MPTVFSFLRSPSITAMKRADRAKRRQENGAETTAEVDPPCPDYATEEVVGDFREITLH